MTMSLTSYALDGKASPVRFDLEECRITMPLQGFWLAEVRTTTATGRLGAPAPNQVAGAPGQVPTMPGTASTSIDLLPRSGGQTYDASGPCYDSSGTRYSLAAQAPPWVYAGLALYQPVTVTLGGQTFLGTVVRSGLWRDQVSSLIQAGATQVGGYPGGGLARAAQSVYEVLVAVAQAANAVLSPLVDVSQPKYAALATTILNFQPSATLRLSETLSQLTRALNAQAGPAWAQRQASLYRNAGLWPASVTPVPDLYHWRFLPDGTLWLGLDFYPTEADAGTAVQNDPVPALGSVDYDLTTGTRWLDNRPQQGLETFGVTKPVLFPGDTYVSPQTPYSLPWPLLAQVSTACIVEHHWNAERLLMTVLNGAGSSPVAGVVSTEDGGQAPPGGW